ncbi:hypothetical protein GOL96_13525 [Sinorhizobium medicae]|nr:hypothetical protein [Sinorhizobium medicae]MDX1192182.1 hypothetical protein [Sinorhizobium medicae]MDX1234862.1 hypothetical protein [Sinorhizobium medicae]RVL60360.1 hypothetical protein CN141_12700 [Sinorhizobium meliloti]
MGYRHADSIGGRSMRIVVGFSLWMALGAGQANAACNADLLSVGDWSARRLDDGNMEVQIIVKSNAPKPIRMLDADFGFKDALGGHVAADAFERDIEIPASGSATTVKKWPLTFERLLKLKREEVAAYACVRAVLYEDGTKEEFK